jgi:hypothetical protein
MLRLEAVQADRSPRQFKNLEDMQMPGPEAALESSEEQANKERR